MQKICLVLAFAALLVSVVSADAEVDEGVLVLTDANFDSELAKYDNLLVEFYAPWCGHCKSLAPEYAKAAKRLRENNPPYFIAKVDATENKVQAEKHGVRGFPTLFFFKNQQKMEYNGGRTENEIVNWILKKVGPTSNEATCESLKEKVAANKLVLAYFGDASTEKQHGIYNEVAQTGSVSEKYQFFHIADKECATSHGATDYPSLVVFRQFEESPLVYSGNWETTPIVDWMLASSVPVLINFSEDYIEPIFGQKNNAIFLFHSKEDESSDWYKVYEQASKDLKGQILFIESGISEGIQTRLAEFVGVEASHLPTIKILNPNDNMKKYQYSKDVKSITVADIKQFIDEFKSGTIQPFMKSEEIPADNSAPVKIVVGKNFNKIVIDNEDDVLIEFYAPWCGHCKKLSPIWDQLAEDLKDVPHLTIAKMDATANEVDGVDVRGYPTLKWYPKGNKTPQDFDGERELEPLKNWLKDKSASYKHYLDKKSEL